MLLPPANPTLSGHSWLALYYLKKQQTQRRDSYTNERGMHGPCVDSVVNQQGKTPQDANELGDPDQQTQNSPIPEVQSNRRLDTARVFIPRSSCVAGPLFPV
jgi:hypothetical protein